MTETDTELIELLKLVLPEETIDNVGFLEIAGMAHYENVNSRIYAYFLNEENYTELASLFVNSLQQLVKEKMSKEIVFERFAVVTEDLTRKNNRIDITLNDIDNETAIIIENKIYHYLNNDLVDYWNHFNYKDDNKIGVLLTLYPHDIPSEVQGKFINVTHSEWVNKIQSNGLPSKLPVKVYNYLNDFFNTIDNLTQSNIMNEQARFYFDHSTKVQLAKKTYAEAIKFIESQISQIASTIGWQVHGKYDDWKNIWDKTNNLNTFYTLWYKPLLDGELKITIIIELHADDIQKIPELDKVLKDNENFQKLKKHGSSNKYFTHYVYQEYTMTISDLENLAKFVLHRIEEDFEDVMKIAIQHNYPGKEVEYLTYNV
ncbi:MAG: PD-(D/E)XK nuclease family protein [Flavobacteriales bacterium]|nr:PD-(D/E)XK nuclease family protein [Flavobacteriales bacterium]